MAAVIGDFGAANRSSPFARVAAHEFAHASASMSSGATPTMSTTTNTTTTTTPPLSASSSFAHKPESSARDAAPPLRVLTPPEYASDARDREGAATTDSDTQAAPMPPLAADPPPDPDTSAAPTPTAARPPPPTNAIPSPASDDQVIVGAPAPASPAAAASISAAAAAPPPPPPPDRTDTPPPPPPPPPARIQKTVLLRDLNHLQALAQRDRARDSAFTSLAATFTSSSSTTSSSSSSTPASASASASAPSTSMPTTSTSMPTSTSSSSSTTTLQDLKFEISAMPIADVIEMVAALLTRITTTNDREHDVLRSASSPSPSPSPSSCSSASSASSSSTSPPPPGEPSTAVLAFHGKNVPAITILSYLSRIHKYCPTTYEVFLSLLVYFDRMAQQVNDVVAAGQRQRGGRGGRGASSTPRGSPRTPLTPSDVVDSDDDDGDGDDVDVDVEMTEAPEEAPDETKSPTYFVVDSYNIHRLIIAGVTCASKFFSDVFYTNSRYAKVGGLPLAELNHLELQFLILNDFRLAIPIEDLEAYATMLVEFYAREVVNGRAAGAAA